MDIDTAKAMTEFMQTSGGWGMVVVFGVVIWRLWIRLNEKDERIFTLLDKQNDLLGEIKKIGGDR